MEKMEKMFKTYDDKYLQAIVMYGFSEDTKLYYDEAKSRHVTTIDEMKDLFFRGVLVKYKKDSDVEYAVPVSVSEKASSGLSIYATLETGSNLVTFVPAGE